MSMFVITKNQPIRRAAGGPGRPPKYPLREMDIGDEFEVGYSHRDAQNCRAAVQWYRRSNPGKKFQILHVGGNTWVCQRIQ